MSTAKVYLVGAGPGDRGLLTLRGAELLADAEVVLYDALVGPGVLEHIAPGAERVYVGKRGGDKAMEQADVNARLVAEAQAGRSVVRLKGGDPFLLARGGEEAEALADAGIPFEVVPGVSSVTAATAYAGIPLTDRRFSSSVTVVTGHEVTEKPQDGVPWDRVATSAQTLVVLMGLTKLSLITERLVSAGWDPSTPAAAIEWGTLPHQKTVRSTLGELVQATEKADLKAPAVTIIGGVVSLSEKLDWFSKRPLAGRLVVTTRARQAEDPLRRGLEELGAAVLEQPVIAMTGPESWEPADKAIGRLSYYDWLIVTSANAIEPFLKRLHKNGRDLRDLGRAKIAAIGPATAAALEAIHLVPDVVAKDQRAEGLLAALEPHGIAGRRFLFPRAAEAREVIPDTLRKQGAEVEVVPVYRTLPLAEVSTALKAALAEGKVDAVTFTSSSTVHGFAALFDEPLARILGGVAIACIGPVTAETVSSYGARARVVPESYAIPDLVDALGAHFKG